MTYTLKVIYDGTIGSGNQIQTLSFSHSPLIFFDIPNGVFAQMSGYLSCTIPVIGKVLELDCLLDKFIYNVTNTELANSILEDLTYVPVFDSLYLYHLPFEFSYSDLSFYLRLSLGSNIGSYPIKIYCLQVATTPDSLREQLEEIQKVINRVDVKQNINLAVDVSQNIAIGIIGTGLIPITAGVTTPVPIIVGQPIAGLLGGF